MKNKIGKNKKRGLLIIGAGMLCLAISILLLLYTESIFSTILLYVSVVLNVVGLYILLWVKDRREENDKK